MRRIVMATAGLALGVSMSMLMGCAGPSGVLELEINGKRVEVHDATELQLPKGNESHLQLQEWTLRIAGQEPISVIAGGQEHTLYTTDTTIQINGRAVDLMPGEKIVITRDGVTLPNMQNRTTPPAGDGDKGAGDGDKGQ